MRIRVLSASFLSFALLNAGCSKKEEAKAPPVKPTPVSNTTPAPAIESPAPTESTTPAPAPSSGGQAGGYGGGYASSQGQSSGAVGASYGAGYGASAGPSGASGGYGAGYGGNQPAKELPPITWMEAATKAFEKGNDVQANRFAKAAAILNVEESSKVIDSVRWSPTSGRPELLSEIAVGVELDAPKEGTEYNPIFYGIMEQPGGGGGYGGGGPGGGYGGGNQPKAKKAKPTVRYEKLASKEFSTELEKAAGLMATELLVSMNEAHSQGAWEPFFAEKTVAITMPKKPVASSGGGYGGSGYGAGYSGGGGGGYGAGYGNSYGAGYGGNTPPIPAKNDALNDKLIEPREPRLVPGLHYIGTGKSTELCKRAQGSGYKSLIIFTVVVKENRKAQYIQNECDAKLWDLKGEKPKVLSASKPLKNNEVAKEMAEGDEDVIKKAMAKFLEQVRSRGLVSEFPAAINAEVIKAKRLPTLIDDSSIDPLDRLFEAYYWKSKNMLTEPDYQLVAEKVLGENAAKLVTGSEEERKEIMVGLL